MSERTTIEQKTSTRRHDLDALRAVAMLLGIVLHGAITFFPFPAWAVVDAQGSEFFPLMVSHIHGFRMQLFFLLSGFFTAMLWRKRGMLALLQHRYRRIFRPLMLGIVTIFPASIAVGALAGSNNIEIIQAAAYELAVDGEVEQLEFMLAYYENDALRFEMDTIDNKTGNTLLHIAADNGHVDLVRWLLGLGFDLDAVNLKNETPLDLAMQAGHEDVSATLDRAIAGEQIRLEESNEADDAATIAARGTGQYGDLDSPEEDEGLAGILFLFFYIGPFGHLWFLWYLCWLLVMFALVIALLKRLPPITIGERWVITPMRYLWLIPLTMIPQVLMFEGGAGADTGTGILPMPHVLLYYSAFFFFGALYFHYDVPDHRVALDWGVLLLSPVLLLLTYTDGIPGDIASVTYAWLLSFALMGIFSTYFSQESKTWRYISDSSYWLYLAHIPFIYLPQLLVQPWDISPFIKLPIVVILTSGVLLLTYETMVRYTWIGELLNGRKTRPTPFDEQRATTRSPQSAA